MVYCVLQPKSGLLHVQYIRRKKLVKNRKSTHSYNARINLN